jgi:hypothetical protein
MEEWMLMDQVWETQDSLLLLKCSLQWKSSTEIKSESCVFNNGEIQTNLCKFNEWVFQEENRLFHHTDYRSHNHSENWTYLFFQVLISHKNKSLFFNTVRKNLLYTQPENNVLCVLCTKWACHVMSCPSILSHATSPELVSFCALCARNT